MRPLMLVSQMYNAIFTVIIIVTFGPDYIAIIREWVVATGQRRDRGSFAVFLGAMALGWTLDALCSVALPGGAIATNASAQLALFWVGIALIVGGMAFRAYAILTLGRYFTREVRAHAGQNVVQRGPYRYIRHPSYTGLLVALLGMALTLDNWAGLAALLLCAGVGCAYRIAVEERELRRALGDEYIAYMRRTRRLIPFVL